MATLAQRLFKRFGVFGSAKAGTETMVPVTSERMGGAYEAADRRNRETATWVPALQSPDADILPGKPLADARALDIFRNDAFVAAGAALHKDSVIGAQYLLNARPAIEALGLDETWETEFQEEVETKFSLWAESHRNWIDASRRNTFTSMLRLAVGVYLHSGEVLMTSEWINRSREPRPYNTAYQMIEAGRLSDPRDRFDFNKRIRGGIQFDSYGSPIAYYIRRPSVTYGRFSYAGYEPHTWSRIRAFNSFGRPQVFHILEQQRPGQSRGISQLVAALKEMRTTKRFRDLVLQKAALNASFFASIESEIPTAEIFAKMGAVSAESVEKATQEYAEGFLGAVASYSEAGRAMQMDGVRIPHFFPGTKLEMNSTATPDGVGDDFEAALLRYIAANLDVSYEELSKDYRNTSYSAARAGMLSTWKSAQSRKKMVVDRLATLMFRNWFEEALNVGNIDTMNAAVVPNFYDNQEAFLRCSWIGAARGQIDELKETQAATLRVRHGLTTYEEELSRQGKDWREQFKQRQREKELAEELGITLGAEDDPAMNSVSGSPEEGGGDGQPTD